MSTLSPARIMEVGMAFWPAKVLLSAIELGVFTTLGAKSMTGRELQGALRLHPRANPDFFDTLLALHFLERDGDGPEARYRNTKETALFLDRNSPQFMGGFLEMANARLYPFWGTLTEGLRTGQPQNEIKTTGNSLFAELYSTISTPGSSFHLGYSFILNTIAWPFGLYGSIHFGWSAVLTQ